MWTPFRRLVTGIKLVADGLRFRATCPTCEHPTQFDEIEVGVPFGGRGRERALRCRECCQMFDVRPPPRAAALARG